MNITHGSLFSGIGAVDLAFEKLGIKTAWQVEIDDYANRILELRFPDAKRIRDVTKWQPGSGDRVDILSGGFPCQDLSNAANNRKGLSGERSGLWWEMLRIIERTTPTVVLIENVPNLRRNGLWEVLLGLAELGYDAEWSIISAEQFGLAHRRNRLFIVAYPNGINGDAGEHYERFDAMGARSEVNASARSCRDGGDVLRWLVEAYGD